MRRRRIALTALAVLVLAPLLLVAAALGWLQTGTGKRQLAALIEGQAAGAGLAVEIGALEGSPPFDFSLRDLAIADAEGVWLRLDRATLDWTPLSLLRGAVDIRQIAVGTLAIDRLPARAAAAEGDDGFPGLPVAIRIERLVAEQIALGAPVLGAPVGLAVEGSARLEDPAAGLDVTLAARRVDGVPGSGALALRYRPPDDRLTVDLSLNEPAGGIVARATALPGLPPVAVALTGDGPLDGWRGRFTAAAGALVDIGIDLSIDDAGDDRRFGLTGRIVFDGLLDAATDPLFAGGVDLTATAMLRSGGIVEAETIQLAAPAGTLVVEGVIDTGRNSLDTAARLTFGAPAAYAGAMPGLGWSDAAVEGRLSGRLGRPTVEVTARAADLVLGGIAAGRFGATLEWSAARGWDRPQPLSGRGTVEGLTLGDPALDRLFAPAAEWTLAASVMSDRSLSINRLTIASDALQAEGEGRVEPDGAVSAAGRLMAPSLAAFDALAGLPLAGSADLGWRLEPAENGLDLAVDGIVSQPRLGIEVVDPLFGDDAELSAAMRIGFDGTFAIDRLVLSTAGTEIAGSMAVAEGRLDAAWALSVPAVAPVAEALGVALDGGATAEATLAGPFDALVLDAGLDGTGLSLDGAALPDAALTATLGDLAGGPTGRISLRTVFAGQPVALASGIARAGEGAFRFERIDGDLAGVRLGGGLSVRSDGRLAGAVTGRVEDLGVPAALAGLDLRGGAEFRIALSPAEAGQNADISLTGTAVGLGDALRAKSLSASLALRDIFGTVTLGGGAEAESLTLGGEPLSRAALRVDGALDALDLTLQASGDRLAATVSGRLRRSESATLLRLAGLEIVFAGERFALARPAEIALAPGPLAIDRMEIAGPEGRAVIAGSLGDPLEVTADLERVPLALARLVEPTLGLSGTLSGRLRLDGPRAAPVGSLALTLAEVRTAATRDAELPAADIRIDGGWREGRLSLDAVAGMSGETALTVSARMPLGLDPATGAPVFDAGAPLRGSARGGFDLALFDDLLAAGGNRVAGAIDVDLSLGGTVAAPWLSGAVRISEGEYENAFYGTRLEQIAATLTADGNAFRMTALEAATPGGGRITGEGRLILDRARGDPVDLTVALRSAALVDTPEASAVADADLRLTGALAGTLSLSGEIALLSGELRVPDRLPVSVPTLAVTEINVPPEVAARMASRRPAEPVAAFDVQLDLTASATQAVFVRGRGLDV
ncbi:MAG: hypothetical protein HKM95_06000 [Inquilinus sp.]|nr:hypothetical protein [Inquilinus sp.]